MPKQMMKQKQVDFTTTNKEIICGIFRLKTKPNIEKIMWTDRPPPATGCQHKADVIRTNPSIRSRIAKQIKTPRKAFALFCDLGHIISVVEMINKIINSTLKKLSSAVTESYKTTNYKATIIKQNDLILNLNTENRL